MQLLAALGSCSLLATALASVTPLHSIEKYHGETTGRLIVKLKDGASKASLLHQFASSANVTHDWQNFNGFAGEFTSDVLNSLRTNPSVDYIAEDGIMHAMSAVTQTNAPWGLARISSTTKLANQDTSALTYSFTYDSSAGAGVDIFILDTGVLTTHNDFGGRARWGATFGGYASADGNGHGTHGAGSAAGTQFGVAKAANIVAVKVLSDAGSGTTSDIISGINWIISTQASTGRPAVVCMSIGGSASTAVDNAVAALTNAGIHVVAAAGNSNTDANGSSPGRAPSAITVGATTIADAKTSASNYGPVLDIWAPGQNVISTWIGSSNTVTNNLSGTSMATAYVAGVVAYYIGLEGNISPAAMTAKLQSHCLKGVLTGIPSGTINCLVHI